MNLVTIRHRNICIVLTTILGAYSNGALASDEPTCSSQCTKYNSNSTLVASCVKLCTDTPNLFDIDYPYVLGPLKMKPYPNLTGIDAEEINAAFPTGGELYVRINDNRTKMQFWLNMFENPTPYYPYVAMHLHQGELDADEIGGHILASVAGAGDLIACVGASRQTLSSDDRGSVCSTECTKGNHNLGNCVNPKYRLIPRRSCSVCNQKLVGAYFCKGGCQGDYRIKGNNITVTRKKNRTETVAPSRYCDLNNPNKPSNPKQKAWIQGVHSHEFSGNPDDGKDYSKYSIGIPENFDLWCGDKLPFLVDDVLKSGQASYIALHVNFNATGLPALLYGDIFTAVSTKTGGAQKCYIFGNATWPCTYGAAGYLKPIGDPY